MDDALNLSYRNARELNTIIDKGIPSRRPAFMYREVSIGGREVPLYYRDALECIRSLFGAPEFASYLIFQPEKQYADEERKIRVYHDMHVCKWWWNAQVKSR